MLTVEFEPRPRCVIELDCKRAKRSLVVTTCARTAPIHTDWQRRIVERTTMRIGVAWDTRTTCVRDVAEGLAAATKCTPSLVGEVRTRMAGLTALLGMSTVQAEPRPTFVIERIPCADSKTFRAVALRARTGVLAENRRIDLREEARMRIGMTIVASPIRLVKASNSVLPDSVTRVALRFRVHPRQRKLRRGVTRRIERMRRERVAQMARPTIRGFASIGVS